jgi:hypothetical protein
MTHAQLLLRLFRLPFFLIQAPKFVFSVALRLLISIQVRQASCDVCAPWIIDVVLVSWVSDSVRGDKNEISVINSHLYQASASSRASFAESLTWTCGAKLAAPYGRIGFVASRPENETTPTWTESTFTPNEIRMESWIKYEPLVQQHILHMCKRDYGTGRQSDSHSPLGGSSLHHLSHPCSLVHFGLPSLRRYALVPEAKPFE